MSAYHRKFNVAKREYPSIHAIPPVGELVLLAQQEEWLLIEVPATAVDTEEETRQCPEETMIEQIVAELSPLLPGFRVGTRCFLPNAESLPDARRHMHGVVLRGTIGLGWHRLVTDAEIQEHLQAFLAAMRQYGELATHLMERLATQLGTTPLRFAETWSWHDFPQTGQLAGEEGDIWNVFFHGVDCCFANPTTHQIIEARLGFGNACGDRFDVLDAWFFLQYLETTEEWHFLYEVLRGSGNQIEHVMKRLQDWGFVKIIESENGIVRGWIPVD